MPERAAETSQVPDDTREELIAKAASEWAAADGGAASASAGFGGVAPRASRMEGPPPGRWPRRRVTSAGR